MWRVRVRRLHSTIAVAGIKYRLCGAHCGILGDLIAELSGDQLCAPADIVRACKRAESHVDAAPNFPIYSHDDVLPRAQAGGNRT